MQNSAATILRATAALLSIYPLNCDSNPPDGRRESGSFQVVEEVTLPVSCKSENIFRFVRPNGRKDVVTPLGVSPPTGDDCTFQVLWTKEGTLTYFSTREGFPRFVAVWRSGQSETLNFDTKRRALVTDPQIFHSYVRISEPGSPTESLSVEMDRYDQYCYRIARRGDIRSRARTDRNECSYSPQLRLWLQILSGLQFRPR